MEQKMLLVIVAVVVVGVAGVLFYLPTLETPQQMTTESQIVTTEPEISAGTDAELLTVGTDFGNVAPDFTLKDGDGNDVSLSDFRGKVVFLNFWASWCPFCVNEMPDIENAVNEAGDGVVAVFVNRGESIAVGQGYIDTQLPIKINSPTVYDTDETVFRTYGFGAFMPISYILDEEGVIKDRKFGPLTRQEVIDKVDAVVTG